MKGLSKVFDFQRFQQNSRLSSIISDVESRYSNVIADEDLEMVHAAGVTTPVQDENELFNHILPPPEERL